MKTIIALTVCAVLSLSAQVKMVSSPLPLDGSLTGNGWQDIPEQSDFRRLKGSGKIKPDAPTSFRLAADRDNLYLSVLCKENQMEKLRKSDGAYDLWETDSVEIFFSPSGRADDYYQFAVSAAKVRFSMYYEEAGVIRPDPYLPFWESKVFYGKDYWLVQLRIPFSSFYMTRNDAWNTAWRVNIARMRFPVRESSSWSLLQGSFQEPRNFRKMTGFPKRKPEHDLAILDVKPTITDFSGGVYSGPLELTVLADSAAAGKYELTVEEPDGKSSNHAIALKGGRNRIVLKKTEYLRKNRSKTDLRLTLKALKTGDIFGRSYPVSIHYEPVRISLRNPCYKQSFFPGQDHSVISGELNLTLSAAQKKRANVELSLSGDGLAEKTLKFKAGAPVIPFTFDSKSLDEGGKAVLSVKILDKGREIAAVSRTVTRLKKNAGSMLWIKDGILYRNGNPCFFRTMSAMWYMGGTAIAERIKKDDLGFLFPRETNLEPVRLVRGIESTEATKDVKPCPELFGKIRKKVESVRNDPSFDMYYLCDEPEYRDISPVYLKYLYDFISKLDPYHPVIICTQQVDRYSGCADIFRGHPYYKPVVSEGKRTLSLTMQQVRDRIHNMTKVNRPDKVIGYTGQFFSCKYINLLADYPTWGELECSTWSALAQGARMFWPYAYHDLGDRPQIYEGTRYFNQSIIALEKQLLSNRKYPVKKIDPENMIDTLLTEGDGVTLLIVVNLKNGPLETEVGSDHLKQFNSLLEFRGSGSRKIADGKLKLSLKPYECVVLTSKKMDAGLKTRDQVLSDIANADKARAARGNLLFEKGALFEVDSSNPVSPLQQRNKLFDGTIDMIGWQSKPWSKDNWYEMNFRKNPPKFSKIWIHGFNLGDPSVKIWKFGEWKVLTPEKTKKAKYSVLLDFGEEVKSVKVRITFPFKVAKIPIELYEIELLK